MTRTREKCGPKANNLQPTKLSARREESKLRVESTLKDLIHTSTTPREIFESSSLKFSSGKSSQELGNEDNGEGDKIREGCQNARRKEDALESKVGLGSVFFNVKPFHYLNSKKPIEMKALKVSLDYYQKKYNTEKKNSSRGIKKKNNSKSDHESSDFDISEASLNPLCKGMKKLSIFKEEVDVDLEKDQSSKEKTCRKQKQEKNYQSLVRVGGHMQQSFKTMLARKMSFESGVEISVLLDDTITKTFKKSSSALRKAGVRNWKSPEASTDYHAGLVRNIFSWSLPTSTRWKEVEERIVKWTQIIKEDKGVGPGGPNLHKTYSLPSTEEIADQLNITLEDLLNLKFHKDLKKIVERLKTHIVCHSSLSWLSTLVAVSAIQEGNHIEATKNASESQGVYLHSEIIDKHTSYLSRNEETGSTQRSSFSTKAELFRKQIQDTLEFGRECNSWSTKKNSKVYRLDEAAMTETAFTKAISTFNPDWNVVQITALLQAKNRFGMDLLGRRQIPQLVLSVMAQLLGETERACFTTFCPDPPVQDGSMMRLGLMEEFQKILDRNLMISDDSIVISRRNYWDERNKHNQALMCVIQAMEEDWIGLWNFLLPGHTKHQDLREKIHSKVISPATKKYKLNQTQKLVLYKITENYKCLSRSIAMSLETVLSFILNIPENTGLNGLSKRIREIGLEIPHDNRHPTILVVDQDLEIYPWESMTCLHKTDVTRMPSLNLIHSNYNFVQSLRPTYPDIVDGSSCTFVLNPDGTLPNVQKRLEQYLLDHKDWLPVIARPPATKEIQECLENQHVFLYNGHGAGSNFYPDYAVQKLVCQAVPLLMGCASAQAHYATPRVYGSHTIHSYFLAGCPTVVGYLWEITDGECDRITVDLIERWLPDDKVRPPDILFFDKDTKRDKERCLSTAMRMSRKAATQFLTQCAIVCYGLPINTQH